MQKQTPNNSSNNTGDKHKDSSREVALLVDDHPQEDEENVDMLALCSVSLAELQEYVTMHRAGKDVARGSLNEYLRATLGDATLIAHLDKITIHDIDLSDIDLSGACIENTVFANSVIFNNTNLRGAYLLGAVFNNDLTTTNMAQVICTNSTSFHNAKLGLEQERDVCRHLELKLQRGGMGALSIISGFAAGFAVTTISGGVGLVPIVFASMTGLGTSVAAEHVGNRIIDHNINEDGVVGGKMGHALGEIGAVREIVAGPIETSAIGIGGAVLTRSLPYVPGVSGLVGVSALAFGGYHATEAVQQMNNGRSPAAVVATRRPVMEELRDDIRGVGAEVIAEVEEVEERLDQIPFCHKLINALKVGGAFTLLTGIALLGLALGHVINTDDLPSSLGTMGASLIGTLLFFTGIAYYCDGATNALLGCCSGITRMINCCFTCGRGQEDRNAHNNIDGRGIEVRGVNATPFIVPSNPVRGDVVTHSHVSAVLSSRATLDSFHVV